MQEGDDLLRRGHLTENLDVTLGASRCRKVEFVKRPCDIQICVGNPLGARIKCDERIVDDCLYEMPSVLSLNKSPGSAKSIICLLPSDRMAHFAAAPATTRYECSVPA